VSHSANKTRHTVHRQSLLCRVLFLGHSAKRFAECHTTLGKEKQPLRRRLTETASLPSVPVDTRQRINLCRVPPGTLGKEPDKEGPHVRFFVECYVRYSTKRASLPSVRDITLGKEPIPMLRSWFFAECYGLGVLCRVPATWHSAKKPLCRVLVLGSRQRLTAVSFRTAADDPLPSTFFAECYSANMSLLSVVLCRVSCTR
jgi:hypothetical protein